MRVHGRRGRLYAAMTGTVAEPVGYLNAWAVDIDTDRIDVTVRGDTNKTYVASRPTISGNFKGWYDQATADTYTNASTGLAKRFYIYPTANQAPYWFGTAVFDFRAEGAVDGAVSWSADWWPATFWKVGTDGAFSDGFSTGFEVD